MGHNTQAFFVLTNRIILGLATKRNRWQATQERNNGTLLHCAYPQINVHLALFNSGTAGSAFGYAGEQRDAYIQMVLFCVEHRSCSKISPRRRQIVTFVPTTRNRIVTGQ